MRRFFTSESVSQGHPDKVCDQISDAVLDAMLAQDPNSRVACETLVTTGLVVVAGEVTSKAVVDIQEIVRKTIREIGYDKPALGFEADGCGILTALHQQSPDISQGVTQGEGLHKEQGAGDQGIMFGFACNETDVCMPLSIHFSHRIVEELVKLRESGEIPYLRPDSKSQITVEYDDLTPKRVDTVVISTQHDPDVEHATIKQDMIEKVVKKVIPAELLDSDTTYHINPTGRFVIGGPHGDSGVTGRKIIVDTYGGYGAHGGGAFSGKDPSKVDRSAAYAARWVAKNVVASGLATHCEIQLSYAIGVPEPLSIHVDTYGTGKLSELEICEVIRKVFDLTPAGIIEKLDLKRPIYRETARNGHFGRELQDFTWEKTDMVEQIKKEAGL
ncbi:methionine adenosyltransferase [Chitinispirillales bacterium ANBcel5]|uniref:methionine adenosyltransferase n=1 Tax=Cellulosispirillum alkaliphilum TaxID=3039283 RepID=UPI002A557310|nr:methionine adenosyltransferase [Chitinispirillales bacterium ANBcel5]